MHIKLSFKLSHTLFILLLILQLTQSCKVPSSSLKSLDNNCYTSYTTHLYDSLLVNSTNFIITPDSVTLARFSPEALTMASTLGIMDLLNQYANLEAATGNGEKNLELLFVRQELDERLTLSTMDISTLIAELDCEQNRVIEARNILQEQIDHQLKKLNIVSFTTGAAGGFLSAYLSLVKPEANTAIQTTAMTGAVLAAYFSFRTLSVKKHIYFLHTKNYLKEIWINPTQSQLFHPNIWFYLHKDSLPIRDKLIEEFYTSGILTREETNSQKAKRELLFGNGGKYNLELLNDRNILLELVEIRINSMRHRLKLLQEEIIIKPYKR